MKMNNDNFVWTDELILEFVRWTTTASPTFQGRYADLEQFKKSKSIPNKEYEILSYIDPTIVSDIPNYNVINNKYSISWHKAEVHGYKIHSVRRISDGEVFTGGDITNYGRITGFHIEVGIMVAEFEGNTYPCYINLLEKKVEVKKPILITEDGVSIYEGDRVWFVDKLFNIDQYDFIDMGDKTEDLKHYPELYKYFSTEEKAKEHIRDNKPTFSVNQIYKICSAPNFSMHDFKNLSSNFNRLV